MYNLHENYNYTSAVTCIIKYRNSTNEYLAVGYGNSEIKLFV